MHQRENSPSHSQIEHSAACVFAGATPRSILRQILPILDLGTTFTMSAPPTYFDQDGRLHFLTPDGLPPNHGVPLLPPFILLPTSPIRALFTQIFHPSPPEIKYVTIKFIGNGVRPHRDRFTGRDRDEAIVYTTCVAATSKKVEDLIREMGGSGARGITECKLLVDGRTWLEVQTFKLGDDNLQKTLAEVGWTNTRGVNGPPVWVCPYHPGLEEEEEKQYWQRQGFLSE